MKPDIFDPLHYGSTRLADSEAETLPAWAYTSPEFYEREAERIFMRVWNFIGRAEHIPNPGDYFTLEFAGVPVIVVRDDAGRLYVGGWASAEGDRPRPLIMQVKVPPD